MPVPHLCLFLQELHVKPMLSSITVVSPATKPVADQANTTADFGHEYQRVNDGNKTLKVESDILTVMIPKIIRSLYADSA